jgi:hypothetical protein
MFFHLILGGAKELPMALGMRVLPLLLKQPGDNTTLGDIPKRL